MVRSVGAVLVAALGLLVGGCLPKEGSDGGGCPVCPGGGTAVLIPFETVDQGVQSGVLAEGGRIVRDPVAWEALWAEHVAGRVPAPPLPPVDFSREMVLAYFLGEKPTSGYAVEIREIAVSEGRVLVHVAVTTPPPGAPVLQVLTQPFHIVRAPRSELPVEFIPVEADPGPKRRG